jgi:3-deoxy-D-manno-octulosonate 8-phosphate phosphatase (KDO 8-P phosphatase)
LLGAGLSFAPADSEEKAKANADIVLNRRGGYGAVREAVEKIIKYNNRNRED